MDINKDTIVGYINRKLPDFFGGDSELQVSEIGDGNINYVYRLEQPSSGKSLIVKHAEASVRSSGRSIGTQRSAIEAEVLLLQRSLAPEYLPEIYLYDEELCNIVMQDMREYANMRYGLMAHTVYPHLARHLADFCAKTLISTCDVVMPIAKKRELAQRYTNIPLCDISERLVFTEPYYPAEKNSFAAPNASFVESEIYSDSQLKLAAAKLKNLFKSKAQSLVHGDLHSGSVFCTTENTCVLDPEFAFYGPAGYDVGNIIGNTVFAIGNAQQTIEDPVERSQYIKYLVELTVEFANDFRKNSLALLEHNTTDSMMQGEAFAHFYVDDIMRDSAGFAGTEIIRRIIGSAKVKDITCIADPHKRAEAEQFCLCAAKRFMLTPDNFLTGKDYADYFTSVL